MRAAVEPPIESINDIDVLRRLLLESRAETETQALALRQAEQRIAAQQEREQSFEQEALYLRTWIEKLKLQIAKLKRLKFGRSSEKLDGQIEQLELIVEELEASEAQLPRSRRRQTASDQNPDDPSRTRRVLPESLPRETVEHSPGADCPGCGAALRRIGEDVSEQLEFVPEHFKVIRHVRPRLACRCCERVLQAPAPSRPIDRGIAGPGPFGARPGEQVPGSPAAVSAVGDLCPPGRRTRSGDARRLGRPVQPADGAAHRGAGRLRDGGTEEAARRRHARTGPAAGPRHDQVGPILGLCPRRSQCRQHRPAGGAVPVLARPQGPSSAAAPEGLPRRSAGRCLRRLRCALQAERAGATAAGGRSGLLGSRTTQVLRSLRGDRLTGSTRGARAHCRALQGREGRPRQDRRRTGHAAPTSMLPSG